MWEVVAGVSDRLLYQWEGVSFAEGVALLMGDNRRDYTAEHEWFGNWYDCTKHASFCSHRQYMRKPLFDLQEEVAIAAL